MKREGIRLREEREPGARLDYFVERNTWVKERLEEGQMIWNERKAKRATGVTSQRDAREEEEILRSKRTW